MKSATEASGAKEAALALNQTTDAAKRLQAIFDRAKGEPGIAESPTKTRDAAGDLARGSADMAGPVRAAVSPANDAQRANDPWSQPLPGDSSRTAKHLDGKSLAAALAPSEPAERRATGPQAAGREVAAKRSERRQIPKDEHPGEEVPAAPLGAAEATGAAPETHRPATDAPTDAPQAAAPAKPLRAAGASGDLESRFGIRSRAEAGERADARNRRGPASTQPERDAMPAGDPIEPAIKALCSEMTKIQDQRMRGLRQALEVIATHSDAMDGLIQFMQTLAAHQEQLRADLNDHGRQLAAWARTTQIP